MSARSRRGRTVALLTLAAAVLAAPLRAGSDAEVKSRIEERLTKAGIAQNADIHVSVEDGAVRLTGIAVRYIDFRDAERLARKEADRVINTIRVVPEKGRSDRAIKADVESAILRWASYERFDAVGVEVKQGVVRLTGWVDYPWKREAIENQVANVDGIRDVLADLRVQGFSNNDVELRIEIFTRIYSDPLFERYSANPIDPPIRVFVDHGRVTLAGTVSSKVEQAKAGHIARSTLAFTVDNQVKVEGEEAKKEDRKKDRDKDPEES